MSLTVKDNSGGDFEMAPEGAYIARCYSIIDLGTQVTEWQGDKRQRQKVLISWELLDPAAKMSDGRPFSVSKRYTASLNENAQLRKDLQTWRGKRFTDEELEGFDLGKILGAYCQMQIVHAEGGNGKTYANVDAIMSTKEKPEPINPDVQFDINKPDMEVFEGFGERLKEIIQATPEWVSQTLTPSTAQEAATAADESGADKPIDLSEIPF